MHYDTESQFQNSLTSRLVFKSNPSSGLNMRLNEKMDVFCPCRGANGQGTGPVQSGVQRHCHSAVWPHFNGLSSEGPLETAVLSAACDFTPFTARTE